ncbi:DUF2200 domain-containing protein [Microbacterium sp.]|uniref:DUF2200 domain-containing protein n=1 Tax=Microbacterium sp. TaxID=51671 RepID=UPI0039E29CC3
MDDEKKLRRVFGYQFSNIYDLYAQKVEAKGRTGDELDEMLRWLTGYSPQQLEVARSTETDLEQFITHAPALNPARDQVTGVICGVRIEDIENELMRELRIMDKLVDELARGRAMEKVLRSP